MGSGKYAGNSYESNGPSFKLFGHWEHPKTYRNRFVPYLCALLTRPWFSFCVCPKALDLSPAASGGFYFPTITSSGKKETITIWVSWFCIVFEWLFWFSSSFVCPTPLYPPHPTPPPPLPPTTSIPTHTHIFVYISGMPESLHEGGVGRRVTQYYGPANFVSL